jgi:hypothetical protein
LMKFSKSQKALEMNRILEIFKANYWLLKIQDTSS